ncbi:MAG: TPM domain-containing protein [Deltaproteobacteria bacterium]|nr:TPM domain-containing protein [Deltaproteobacteria bacterium]
MLGWKTRPVSFLLPEERERVRRAIEAAERASSGEIRVVISRRAGRDALATARRVFRRLRMDETRDRNAVLILVAIKSHRFAILGDEGIHRFVGQEGWDRARDLLAERFHVGDFAGGLVAAVEDVGTVLKAHFPCCEGDRNELSDEVLDE